MPVYRHSSTIPYPVDQVLAWHERPGALERLVPPWEDMRVVGRSGGSGIAPGSRVELRVKKGPLNLTWELEHTDVEPGRQFVDLQVRGPFEKWMHTHRFSPSEEGGTRIDEIV